jgi:membrane fusion protein (multidrug efflux system)
MLVNDEGKVEARDIRTVQSKGDKWVVTEGLQAGDRIIIEGLQKARPGAPVTVEEAAAPASAPASAGRG